MGDRLYWWEWWLVMILLVAAVAAIGSLIFVIVHYVSSGVFYIFGVEL